MILNKGYYRYLTEIDHLLHGQDYNSLLIMRPHGDSNPGYRRERAMS